jgi:hypothetical protein
MDVSTWLALPDVEGNIGQNKIKLIAEQLDNSKCALKSGPIEVFVKDGNDWIRATGHITLTVHGSERWRYDQTLPDFTRLPKSYETFIPCKIPTPVSAACIPTTMTSPADTPRKSGPTSTSKPSTKPKRNRSSGNPLGAENS